MISQLEWDNSHFDLHFSEAVKAPSGLSTEDIEVSIVGPLTRYSFSHSLQTVVVPGSSFDDLRITLSIKTSILQDEQLRVKLLSTVTDLVGNELFDQTASRLMNELAVATPTEKQAADSSGVTITILFVVLFVLNLIVGTVFEDALRYFWNLAHLLQLLRIIVLVNLITPPIL